VADNAPAFAQAVTRLLGSADLRFEARQRWQAIAGKGFYMASGVEKVRLLKQPGIKSVRYTGTVNAFRR
jgi:hypothetical protein